MIRRVSRFDSNVFRRERVPSPLAISVSVSVYFLGALAVCSIDRVFLLFAWLMAGLMMLTVYVTFDTRTSLLNPYTLFFAVATLGGLIGYLA